MADEKAMVKLSEDHQVLVSQMESKEKEIHELKEQVEEVFGWYQDMIKRNIVVTNTLPDGRKAVAENQILYKHQKLFPS